MTATAQLDLNTEAARLLDALRMAGATSADHAMTDARLAERMHVQQRAVIDAAGELLNAGRLVLAGAHGRWLGTEAEALTYIDSLRRRAVRILQRRSAVKRALRKRHQLELPLRAD